MQAYWGPEFEPSVEEIVDYQWDMAILSVRFLWRARTRGDFPIQSSTWQVEVHRLKPRAPIYAYTEHVQFVNVSWFELWWRRVARCNTFHEGQGM